MARIPCSLQKMSEYTLDSSNRLRLPKEFEARLDKVCRFILTIPSPRKRCVWLLTADQWNALRSGHLDLDPVERRTLFGHAIDAHIRSRGRLTIPPMLTFYLGNPRKIVWHQQDTHVELAPTHHTGGNDAHIP